MCELRDFGEVNIFKKMYLVFGSRDVIVMNADCASVIANMQRDLDAYRHAWVNITGFLNGKFGGHDKTPAILEGEACSDEVNGYIGALYDSAVSLRHKYDELDGNIEVFKEDKFYAQRELKSLKAKYDALQEDFDKLSSEYDVLKTGVASVDVEPVSGDVIDFK